MHLSPLSRLRRGAVALAVLALAGLAPVVTSPGASPANAAEPPSTGYWMVASDGGIFAYGGARFFGSTGSMKLNMPIVGMAATPSGNGYWLVASDGGIFSFGDAAFHGSTGSMALNKPIVGMAATPSGKGYWLVASDGGIFSFGDAAFYGSTGAIKLNKPITGMTVSATGRGYRLVASDGGIFSFGDAVFHGSAGSEALAKPISGMAPTPSGKGYWLVGSDGKVFPYGDAVALGSAGSLGTVAAVASTPTGAGYWAVAANGALASFGDAVDLGHPTGKLSEPIVGMATVPSTAGAGGTTDPTRGTGGPGTGPAGPSGPVTAPPVQPAAAIEYPLFASVPLPDTYGTTAQVNFDPSHPLREACYKSPCDMEHYYNARYAQEIRSLARVGNRLFLGGFFEGLYDHTTAPPGKRYEKPVSFLAEMDARTGKPAADWTFTTNAAPDASVAAMVVAPDGEHLYIGGRFTKAGGGESRRIARLDLQSGLLDPTFKPAFIDQNIHSIALSPDGSRIFIGGNFLEVGGKKVPSVAALNYDGSLVDGWMPPPNYGGSFVGQAGDPVQAAQGAVDALVVTGDGRYLMVGGDFLHLGTRPEDDKQNQKSGLVALNAADGSLAPWRPHNNRPVFDLELSHDKKMVLSAQGGAGGALVAHLPDQEERVFQKHVDGDALTLAVTDKRIYFGGHWDVEVEDPNEPCLTKVPVKCHDAKSATRHRHLVAFHPNGDLDETWTAQTDTSEGPNVMLAGPDGLYLAGNFFNTLNDHFLNGGKGTWHPGFALFPPIR